MDTLKEKIKYRTEVLPDICRTEIYELDDRKYEVMYDHTDKRVSAQVTMYNGTRVCYVTPEGTLGMTMPTGWVTNHKTMMLLMDDIKRLDEFLAAVVENYH